MLVNPVGVSNLEVGCMAKAAAGGSGSGSNGSNNNSGGNGNVIYL